MTKQYDENTKAIKALARNAEKGSLAAQFQLYEYYAEGKYVKKSEAISRNYLQKVESSLTEKALRLKSLNLSMFRRFKELKLDFEESVTVIIGDNGAGKTSIAESISKTLSWFSNNMERKDVNGKPVTHADINISANDYAEVSSAFELGKNNSFEAVIGRVVPGFNGSSPTDVAVIKQFGAMYRHAANNNSIMLPLLAFYSVERSDFKLSQAISEGASPEKLSNRFDALKDALDGSGKLGHFSEHYIELVNLAEGEASKEEKKLMEEVSILEKTIDDVYEGTVPPDSDPFSKRLKNKRKELDTLRESNSASKYKRHLDFVNRAIETLVPDVKNLEVDRSSGKPRLMLENFGNKVNISQLSQGQKMLVALAGDLARRLTTLNPDARRPLDASGIVIIDEIELHLHPKWQQEILLGLQETFPNIQFIVTTHSPQVLSTVDKKCIRKISLNEQGEAEISVPSFQTKGVTSADILARIMGTNSVPEKVEEAQWINEFSRALRAKDKESEDKYYTLILNHFGEGHPVVLDCDSQIRIMEMKNKWAVE